MSVILALSKFELLWFLDGAARGSHLRWNIYETFVDRVWFQLSDDEREFVYTYAKRDLSEIFEGQHADKSGKERFMQMLARFNPANQYKVYVNKEPGKRDKERWSTMRGKNPYVECYKWHGEYKPDWRGYVPDDIIKRVEKVRYRTCTNDRCMARLECSRFLDYQKGDEILDDIGHCKKCEVFIDKEEDEKT